MNQVLEVLIESHSHRRTVYCVEDEGWTMQHSTGKKKKRTFFDVEKQTL